MSKARISAVALAVLVAVGAGGAVYRWAADARAAGADEKGKVPDDEAAVRKTADEFARAFARRDAKAVASLWTEEGEYVGPDGESVRGRAAIEKSYAEFFKEHPTATVEVHIEAVKLLGKHTALEEGSLKVKLGNEKGPSVSRYSVLHVREDDGWKMASVREWVPDPASLVTLKDVEWLIGEWAAKSKDGEAAVTYAWDEDKAYIRGRYTVKQDGKVVSSGSQVIGNHPAGGLRSWQFDRSGATGEWFWTHDENGWVIEGFGVLPDGSEVTAVNLLVPLGGDAFTWQSVARTAAGAELPDTPPIRVTRVNGKR